MSHSSFFIQINIHFHCLFYRLCEFLVIYRSSMRLFLLGLSLCFFANYLTAIYTFLMEKRGFLLKDLSSGDFAWKVGFLSIFLNLNCAKFVGEFKNTESSIIVVFSIENGASLWIFFLVFLLSGIVRRFLLESWIFINFSKPHNCAKFVGKFKNTGRSKNVVFFTENGAS